LLGHRARAVAVLEEGAALGARVNPAAGAQCLTQLALLAADVDDWESATRYASDAVATIDELGLHERPAMALPFAMAALIAAQAGDRENVRPLVKQARYLLPKMGSVAPWSAVQARLTLARVSRAVGDPAQGRALLHEARTALDVVPG